MNNRTVKAPAHFYQYKQLEDADKKKKKKNSGLQRRPEWIKVPIYFVVYDARPPWELRAADLGPTLLGREVTTRTK